MSENTNAQEPENNPMKDMASLVKDAEKNFANAVAYQTEAATVLKLATNNGQARKGQEMLAISMRLLAASQAQSSLAAAMGIGILLERSSFTILIPPVGPFGPDDL